MNRTVNVHAAKTHLSKLLEQVAAGQEIVIARAGKPIARLTPFKASATRTLGDDRQRVSIADDFDEPLGPDALRPFDAPGGF